MQHHQSHRGDPVTPQNSIWTNETYICNVVIYINIRLIQVFVLLRNPKVIRHIKFGAFLLRPPACGEPKELRKNRGHWLILLKYSFELTDCFYVILLTFPHGVSPILHIKWGAQGKKSPKVWALASWDSTLEMNYETILDSWKGQKLEPKEHQRYTLMHLSHVSKLVHKQEGSKFNLLVSKN